MALERRLFTESVEEGLSVFDHHLKDFARSQIGSVIYRPMDSRFDAVTQVNYFVKERLTNEDRVRFFPVCLDWQKPDY
jgi:hypothetical protein